MRIYLSKVMKNRYHSFNYNALKFTIKNIKVDGRMKERQKKVLSENALLNNVCDGAHHQTSRTQPRPPQVAAQSAKPSGRALNGPQL
jgi:hypothetical protein